MEPTRVGSDTFSLTFNGINERPLGVGRVTFHNVQMCKAAYIHSMYVRRGSFGDSTFHGGMHIQAQVFGCLPVYFIS